MSVIGYLKDILLRCREREADAKLRAGLAEALRLRRDYEQQTLFLATRGRRNVLPPVLGAAPRERLDLPFEKALVLYRDSLDAGGRMWPALPPPDPELSNPLRTH